MKNLAFQTTLLLTIGLVFQLAAPAAVFADGGGDEFTKVVHGYQVSLVFEKPVAVGGNPIHIEIKDAHDTPVTNAEVQVSLVEGASEHTEAEVENHSQDEMSGMSGMSEEPHAATSGSHDEMGMIRFEAGHESGEYSGEIAIDRDGEWIIRIHLTIHGELLEVDFPLNVASSQNGGGVLAGFFIINTAIIAAALVIKHKPFAPKSTSEVQS